MGRLLPIEVLVLRIILVTFMVASSQRVANLAAADGTLDGGVKLQLSHLARHPAVDVGDANLGLLVLLAARLLAPRNGRAAASPF